MVILLFIIGAVVIAGGIAFVLDKRDRRTGVEADYWKDWSDWQI